MNTVKYHNDMNTVTFGNFKEKELDLFFSICFKAKEAGTKEIEITFEELKELSSYSNRNIGRFIKDLESTYDKMLGLNIKIKYSELNFEKFNLFTRYHIMGEKRKILIQVSDKFEFLLNKLLGNYTKFDLLEFVSLKSMYSKNLFKLLKQWETKKEREFELEEFKELLGVPESYSTADFNRRVLTPIAEELPQYFYNLRLDKIKTGRRVTHLKFSWESKKQEIEKDKIELEITQSLNSLFEKAKKNRFLTEILTDKNIYKLTEMYEEDQLKKGLLYIYKQVKKEVPNFTYLIKVLETGIQEQEIEIKVVPDQEEKESSTFAENKESETKQETNIDNPLFIAYSNFPETAKNEILERAKQLYLKDVNMKNLTKQHEKYFKAAEKQYIIKVLGGEN